MGPKRCCPSAAKTDSRRGVHRQRKSTFQRRAFVRFYLRRPSVLTSDILTQSTPGSKTVVIHPGSRWLKIGMATDVFPVSIPNVIARRQRVQPVAKPVFHSSIIQPESERETGREKPDVPDAELEDPVSDFF